MKKIGSYEAKTHLSSLLEQVANGESFTITKHGVPIAQLVPTPGSKPQDIQKTIQSLLDFRAKHDLGSENLKEMIREGRKY